MNWDLVLSVLLDGIFAAIAAIKQESGSWKWTLFAACYTTGLAWLVSFAVYQIGGLFV